MQPTRPVWAEIDLNKIRFNLEQIRDRTAAGTMIMTVVKADAYGHGAVPVARTLVDAGADRLGVALPEEGAELREAGFTLPIHVLGETLPRQQPLLVEHNLIPTVSRLETALALDELCRKQGIKKSVHLKVDTGMGRIGVQTGQVLDFVKGVDSLTSLEIEGLMTHFARADEEDKEYTYIQWQRFNHVRRKLEAEGIPVPICHAANSAAVIDLPDFQLDMVRPGIILYGLRPSDEVDRGFELQPALCWKARIVYLKEVPAGTAISYGSTYVTDRKSLIATIPLGYADGFSRLLSNRGEVLVNGVRAPIRGRVCMDQFMIDVSHIPDVSIGDEVVLIGRQGNEEISTGEMARLTGTINYEVTCRITKRVPRIYLGE